MDAIVTVLQSWQNSGQLIQNKAVICPPHARKLSAIYGFKRWPAVVFVRDGAYLRSGRRLCVCGLNLLLKLMKLFSVLLPFHSSIGIPVKSC